MVFLNWMLVILSASVQISLMIFYSMGLIYEVNEVFQDYTVVMKYVNVACTCAAQIILSFIFSVMNEPIQVLEVSDRTGFYLTWEVRRDTLPIFRQECPIKIGNAATPGNTRNFHAEV